jgi:hypothetical protein
MWKIKSVYRMNKCQSKIVFYLCGLKFNQIYLKGKKQPEKFETFSHDITQNPLYHSICHVFALKFPSRSKQFQ